MFFLRLILSFMFISHPLFLCANSAQATGRQPATSPKEDKAGQTRSRSRSPLRRSSTPVPQEGRAEEERLEEGFLTTRRIYYPEQVHASSRSADRLRSSNAASSTASASTASSRTQAVTASASSATFSSGMASSYPEWFTNLKGGHVSPEDHAIFVRLQAVLPRDELLKFGQPYMGHSRKAMTRPTDLAEVREELLRKRLILVGSAQQAQLGDKVQFRDPIVLGAWLKEIFDSILDQLTRDRQAFEDLSKRAASKRGGKGPKQ